MIRYGILALLFGAQAFAYYGRHSTEAILKYDAEVEVEYGNADLSAAKKSTKIKAAIENQIQFLMGLFQAESFAKEFGYKGVLGEDTDFSVKKIRESTRPGSVIVAYSFRGKTVFHKDAFKNTDVRSLNLRLPFNPEKIYPELEAKVGLEALKKCTDEHYYTEGDFWYFWDSQAKGCALAKDPEAITQVTGELTRLPNTQNSFPEYKNLYGDNGDGPIFKVSVFFGYINDDLDLRNANHRDDGFKAFRFVETHLKDMGFELVTPPAQLEGFRLYADGRRVKGINYFHEYVKSGTAPSGEAIDIHVELMITDTAIASKDNTFHDYITQAFSKSDIVVYDGHSGLGGNLDLGRLPTVRFSKKKSQIFFFNGCSSYPYFNGAFFKRKQGINNLDIVTSGLPTLTSTSGPNAFSFIQPFLELKTLGYPRILDLLEESNGAEASYLTGVNGDEDNVHP